MTRPCLQSEPFDPESLDVLTRAFEGACADLGVTMRTPHARRAVAEKVLDLSDGRRDPEVIRAAVVASLRAAGH